MKGAIDSPTHWRRRPGRTAIHCCLLAIHTSFTAAYAVVAIGGD